MIVCHGGVIAAVMSRLFTDEKASMDGSPNTGLGIRCTVPAVKSLHIRTLTLTKHDELKAIAYP